MGERVLNNPPAPLTAQASSLDAQAAMAKKTVRNEHGTARLCKTRAREKAGWVYIDESREVASALQHASRLATTEVQRSFAACHTLLQDWRVRAGAPLSRTPRTTCSA
eukprot:CAMPEP_0176185258 /NCGR_PEP_ID=MMETSP0121_2-20121125/1257_1 /TAXON_ID=160619 /ORGANISM="Kryptoperidinium foliaceum, Strain CCMP 1326" /LENGTH=107 /DNA_ID=CAMNT_0017523697 /DNA_START=368 /DNA_END=688 /DNA_ORIENTATION=-